MPEKSPPSSHLPIAWALPDAGDRFDLATRERWSWAARRVVEMAPLVAETVASLHAQADAIAAGHTDAQLRELIEVNDAAVAIPVDASRERLTALLRDLLVRQNGMADLLDELRQHAGRDAALAAALNELMDHSSKADEAIREIIRDVSGTQMAMALVSRWEQIAVEQYAAAHARLVLAAVRAEESERACVFEAAFNEIQRAGEVVAWQEGLPGKERKAGGPIAAADRTLQARAGAVFARTVIKAVGVEERLLPSSLRRQPG